MLIILIAVVMFASLGFAVVVPILLYLNRDYHRLSLGDPVKGRKVIVCITTIGKAHDVVVNAIIPALKSYGMPIRIIVLAEEADTQDYGVETIRVPASYVTSGQSENKHRALHYFSQWLSSQGMGKETYILHIDDDNIPDRLYVENVFSMPYEAGEGTIRLREYSHHSLNTVADFQRVAYYDAINAFANRKFHPLGVGGEGLTIRADIEAELGWDFGPIAAEDFLMGQNIVFHGYNFGYIPGYLYIAPVTTTVDFFRQRRRWMHHFFVSFHQAIGMSWFPVIYITYLYMGGFLPLLGLGLWATTIVNHVVVPFWLTVPLTYELVMSFGITLYGAWQHRVSPWFLAAFVLQVPVSFYLIATWFYFVFTVRKIGKKDHVAVKV